MITPVYSAIVAGMLIILQMSLMVTVGTKRLETGHLIGDGGDEGMLLAMRRHANLAENAPIFIVTLALLEMLGGNGLLVITLGALFVIARILHAIGLSLGKEPNPARFTGATLTALCGFVAGAYLIYIAVLS